MLYALYELYKILYQRYHIIVRHKPVASRILTVDTKAVKSPEILHPVSIEIAYRIVCQIEQRIREVRNLLPGEPGFRQCPQLVLRREVIFGKCYLKFYLVMGGRIIYKLLIVILQKLRLQPVIQFIRHQPQERLLKRYVRLVAKLIHEVSIHLSVTNVAESLIPCRRRDDLPVQGIVKRMGIFTYDLRRIPECHIRQYGVPVPNQAADLPVCILSLQNSPEHLFVIDIGVNTIDAGCKRYHLKYRDCIVLIYCELHIQWIFSVHLLQLTHGSDERSPVRRQLITVHIPDYVYRLSSPSACNRVCG